MTTSINDLSVLIVWKTLPTEQESLGSISSMVVASHSGFCFFMLISRLGFTDEQDQ